MGAVLTVAHLSLSVHAAVTPVAWYRLGENDAGAVSGQTAKTTTSDFVGANDLRRLGNQRYTNDISPDAARLGSSLAVVFNGINQIYTNEVVSTARDNFGIEAWVRNLTTANGTYLIAHNGNLAANGWGLQLQVTNHPILGFRISYLGELGGGVRVGLSDPRIAGWVHVALVRDNGVSTFYVDGDASGSTSTTTPATPAGGFTLGGVLSPPGALFPGIIDEVRIFTFAPGQFSPNDLLVNQPVATTLAASGLAPGTATLNGSVRSFGFSTAVWFEWGISPNLDQVTAPQMLGSGFTTTNISEVLTGLPAGTYRFRAVASNDLGLALGNVRTFILGATVQTLPPTDVTQTSATFNGAASSQGTPSTAWFEYGFTTSYDSVTPPIDLGEDPSLTNFSHALTGLLPGVSYHYRAVASNSFGAVFGADESFPRFAQRDYIKASDGGQGHYFGVAVAIDGDTMVVGAENAFSGPLQTGAAYVFVRNGDSWIQQAKLIASNARHNNEFGSSVAISGNTIVVGDPREQSNATGVNGNQNDTSVGGAGAAYVFVRTGTNWAQQAYLKVADAEGICSVGFCTGCTCYPGDFFGTSVSVSGDTIVVGAPNDDSAATGVNGNVADNSKRDSGAAYVFTRSGTTWTHQAYLKASNTEGAPSVDTVGDFFGNSVAVSGDIAVIGAPLEDSNAKGVNGDQNNNSAIDSGAIYIFVRSGTTWTQQAYVKASNTESNDAFGISLSLSGNTLVVGASGEDSNATGINGDQNNNNASAAGAAYVFVRSGTTWTQQAYLKASNPGAGDIFGRSLSVSGDTVAILAPLEDSNAHGVNGDGGNDLSPNSGAAYQFTRNGATWVFQNYLKASNAESNDLSGFEPGSVAVSGEFVVMGAPEEDSNARGINGDQNNNSALSSGAVYVFGPPLPPIAEIAVLTTNANIVDGAAVPQIIAAVGNPSFASFSVRNTGNGPLTGLGITFDGPDAAMFSVTTPPLTPLAPASNTTFTIRFLPTSTGTKTGALHIASNDLDENPFDITLSGLSLSFTQDRDNDGLNDASELLMAPLGFNFQFNQSSLVNTLFANANGAGLFRSNQLQALAVNTPLLAKDSQTGLFKLTIGVEKATQLTNFFPFPMTTPQTTINAQGKLEFQFPLPDGAAFFRLESR